LGNVGQTLADRGRARAPLAATVHVRLAPDETWQASLSLEVAGERTERRFEAESCPAVAAAAALIIALAADSGLQPPAAAATGGPPAPPPTVAPPAPPATAGQPAAAPDPSPPPAPSTETGVRPRSQLIVAAGGTVDRRTLPRPPSGGFEIFAGWKHAVGEGWSLRLMGGANYFPTRHLPYSMPEVFGDWSLFDVFVRSCVSVGVSQLELGPCLAVESARMYASVAPGSTMDGDTLPAGAQSWVSFVAGGLLSWNISRHWAVLLRGDLVIPADRPVFGTRTGTDHNPPIYKLPAAALRAGLEVEWAIP
jgi:hypothetical protein